ncbi:MAG: AAA family ATPase, partial [Christensenellaceae bacterium]
GRLTDSHGRTVDFKNTIIIMTSNVGAYDMNSKKIGFGNNDDEKDLGKLKEYDEMKEKMMEALKQTFRPEFINRIDDIIVFHKLNEKDTEKIAELMLESVSKRLKDRDIDLTFTKDAAKLMSKDGMSDQYGARPLRRMIQQTVEDKLSEEILSGNINIGDKVKMVACNGEVAFKKEN